MNCFALLSVYLLLCLQKYSPYKTETLIANCFFLLDNKEVIKMKFEKNANKSGFHSAGHINPVVDLVLT